MVLSYGNPNTIGFQICAERVLHLQLDIFNLDNIAPKKKSSKIINFDNVIFLIIAIIFYEGISTQKFRVMALVQLVAVNERHVALSDLLTQI